MGSLLKAMPATDESTLVSQASVGSERAFDELVRRYSSRVYGLGLRITGTPEDAEDVLQETFLKVYVHLRECQDISRFRSWITRIAANEGLMKLRSRRSQKVVSLEEATDADGRPTPRQFVDSHFNPEELVLRAEAEAIVRRTAQALPAIFRTMFVLRYLEGRTITETARLLRLRIGTVKARMTWTHRHLKARLGKTLA